MDNITLTPATNRMNSFNEFYHFLMEQILDEIGRRKILRQITNDSTPVVVEDELTDTIGEIFKRFEIYDYPINIGYCCLSSVDEEDIDINDVVFHRYPFDVEVELIEVNEYQIKVFADKVNDAKKDLQTIIFDDIQTNPNTNIHLNNPQVDIDNIKQLILIRAQKIVEKYENYWMIGYESIAYDESIYAIKKRISSVPEFANMNITSESIVTMLIGDLIDKVIEIENAKG